MLKLMPLDPWSNLLMPNQEVGIIKERKQMIDSLSDADTWVCKAIAQVVMGGGVGGLFFQAMDH